MKRLKKAAVWVFVCAVILQCAVLCEVAAKEDVAEYSDHRNTILIDLFKDAGVTMDFVKEFPGPLFLHEQETEPPAEDIQRPVVSSGDTAAGRYVTLELTYAEQQLLARVVCVLGEDECLECQQALIEALLNRLLSEEFPNELKELVYGKDGLCAVDLLNAAEVTETEYAVVTRAICGPYLLNEGVTDFPIHATE